VRTRRRGMQARRSPRSSQFTGILTLDVRLTIILQREARRTVKSVRRKTSRQCQGHGPALVLGDTSGGLARRGRGGRRLRRLCIAGGQAFSPVVGDRTIDDGPAVDALPCVEHQKEIGEPLEHHEPFALRTFHRVLPGCDAQLGAKQSKSRTNFCRYVISTC
jgi:hypothetical protein